MWVEIFNREKKCSYIEKMSKLFSIEEEKVPILKIQEIYFQQRKISFIY